MKYRALLIDPGLDRERPVQIYGKDRTLLESWANNILGHSVSPAATVEIYEIYEIVETVVATIRREAP